MQKKVSRYTQTRLGLHFKIPTHRLCFRPTRFSIPQYVARYAGALRHAEAITNGKVLGSSATSSKGAPKKRVMNTTLDVFLKKKKL